MAPPQVDLAKKQPLEDVQSWAEKVGVDKLPPLPPKDAVAVETGTTVVGSNCCAKKRCKKLTIGIIIAVVVVIAVAVPIVAVHRYRHHRRNHHWDGHVDHEGHRGREHIRTEGSKSLIYVARNHTDHLFQLEAVLDYSTNMAGFKHVSQQVCYIDRLHESYDDGCERWRHYQHHARRPNLRPLRVIRTEVSTEVLTYFAGDEIAQLCQGLPTYFVVELAPKTQEHHHPEHHGGHSSHESHESHERPDEPDQMGDLPAIPDDVPMSDVIYL